MHHIVIVLLITIINPQIAAGLNKMDVRIRVTDYEDLPVKLVNGNGDPFPKNNLTFPNGGAGEHQFLNHLRNML